MNQPKLTLISHHLCPYVQRAAIALHEMDAPFERRDIDLANKPDWFLKLSPLGKVPILVVDDDVVLFESSVIAQYVDEITGDKLLSSDPLEKYGQLAWVEFASQLIAGIGVCTTPTAGPPSTALGRISRASSNVLNKI